MRALLFYVLLLWVLPLLIIGGAANLLALRRTRGVVSGTAYRPLHGRLALHWLGERPDGAAEALASHLPATRGLGGWLFLKPLVWAWKVSGHRPPVVQHPPHRPVPISAVVSARSAVFDRVLEESLPAVDQVVILGAGWDTRAYGRCVGRDVAVFEVDAPPTQAVKRQAVEDASLDASHVVFVPCDFQHTSWLDALTARGFDPARPTLLLWEGVTMYLPEVVVSETLRAIAALAEGTRVVFDGFGREWLETPAGQAGSRAVARFYNEPWLSGISTRDGHEGLERFLVEHGLTPTLTWLSDDDAPDAPYAILVGQVGGRSADR